ncbi:hypothetical protein CDAR_595071 [Caerostris darwini]|uniref:Uncharacterized protein n=1 Tax=Caerostris darwini TaxID=1538125 RepID=A0AAV4P7G7_9ARAC|nr:hypothetical protein CDAR_595071 [Caerostris darwini]
MIEKIHDIVLNDTKLKVREKSEVVRFPRELVDSILQEQLHVKKLCARCASQRCLEQFECNEVEFFRRYITVEEIRLHHYISKSNQLAKQCEYS